jgi:hypothetical protein
VFQCVSMGCWLVVVELLGFQAPSKLASLSLYSTTYSLSVNNNLVDCRWLGPDWGGFIHSGG